MLKQAIRDSRQAMSNGNVAPNANESVDSPARPLRLSAADSINFLQYRKVVDGFAVPAMRPLEMQNQVALIEASIFREKPWEAAMKCGQDTYGNRRPLDVGTSRRHFYLKCLERLDFDYGGWLSYCRNCKCLCPPVGVRKRPETQAQCDRFRGKRRKAAGVCCAATARLTQSLLVLPPTRG